MNKLNICFIVLFIFGCLNFVEASHDDDLEDFAIYNYTGNYLIKGELLTQNFPNTPFTTDAVTTIFHADRKRLYSAFDDLQKAYIVNENVSYVFGSAFGSDCYAINITYDQEIAAYQEAFYYDSVSGGKKHRMDEYLGSVKEAASCNTRLHSIFKTDINNVLIVQSYIYEFPIGNTTCLRARSIIRNDIDTLDKNPSHFDPYFVLPSTCYYPYVKDFCATFFPPNHGCSTR